MVGGSLETFPEPMSAASDDPPGKFDKLVPITTLHNILEANCMLPTGGDSKNDFLNHRVSCIEDVHMWAVH